MRAINYREEDFVEVVKDETGGHGADVILDMVGGDYIERNLRAAALDGRIVQIAFLKGSKVEIDLMRLMMRRLTLTGSTLRAQSAEAKARMARAIEEQRLAADRRRQGQAGDRTRASSWTDAAAAHRPHRRPRAYRQDRAGNRFRSQSSDCLKRRQPLYRGLPLHVISDLLFRRRGGRTPPPS